jgi:hypothetical protein
MIRRSLVALALFAGLACSSGGGGMATTGGTGGGSTPTGGTGGGGTASPLAYKPCDPAARVGGFAVVLKHVEGFTPFTAVEGSVRNAVDPTEAWVEMAKEGECRLMVGPMLVCNTPQCAAEQVCAGANKCIPAPASQDVGTVTVTGLGGALAIMPTMPPSPVFYSSSLTDKYPPFGPEAEITLKTGGGKYPAFSLAGRGIEPLAFAGTGLKVARNQPLPVTWTASAKNKSARIHMKLDIAHHGGIAARINCDVADSGSLTIPATLVTKLMDRGLAGWPTLALTRQTVDSTTVGPGCVELVVASEVAREIEVEGVISCNTSKDMPTCPPPPDGDGCKACPAGMTCERDLRCK